MITIEDLYVFSKQSKVPLLGNLESYVFMQEYSEKYSTYDIAFKRLFKDKVFTKVDMTIANAFDLWKEEVNAVILLNIEKYNRYFKINNAKYEAIENYDRYEETTTERKGTISNQNGSVENKIKRKSTIENYKTPNDSNVYRNSSKAESVANADDNTSNTTYNNLKNDIDNHDTIRSHIHGNIGVMTAMQGLREERDFWDTFNFYKIIFVDIVTEICLPIWGNCND